jgi:hypothetical protein
LFEISAINGWIKWRTGGDITSNSEHSKEFFSLRQDGKQPGRISARSPGIHSHGLYDPRVMEP